jgi:hypothetical protein
MEIAIAIVVFLVMFGGIFALAVWIAWRKLRMIAVAIPADSDMQALRYKLTEMIRASGFRESTGSVFRAPAWQRWAVGLQDISIGQADSGGVLVMGPARDVSRIGRVFAGATTQPYTGRQPVWPLIKGFLNLFGTGIVFTLLCIFAAYMAGV